MVLCGNICFSGFYSDDLHVQGAEWGERLSNVVTSYQLWSVCRSAGDMAKNLENKSFAKNKKSMSSLYCYLLYFNLAQIVLCNAIGDFEFANG